MIYSSDYSFSAQFHVFVFVFVFVQLLEIVKREGLSLTAVLTTHHHW